MRRRLEARLLDAWYSARPQPASRLLGAALRPAAALVGAVARRRAARIPHGHLPGQTPVVVVGNLVAGGSGKTPLVIALARALRSRGHAVGIVARGYAGRLGKRAAQGVGAASDPREVGDEAVLLAAVSGCPVVVARQRDRALELLHRRERLDLILSDDGLQHDRLRRDAELVVLDARGLGNRRLLPAGPLREPVSRLARVDAIVFNESGAPGGSLEPILPAGAAPVFRSRVRAIGARPLAAGVGAAPSLSIAELVALCRGRSVAAVAAIGAPQRFFSMLAALGIVARDYPLPDHDWIDPQWLAALAAELILITEKDAVKCARIADRRCYVLIIEAELDPALIDFVETFIGPRDGFQTA